jgi:hypothetical protein
MYYSNPSASSLSNGTNTFPLLFDDIEDGSISDWSQDFLLGIGASTTQARGTYSMRIYDATSSYTAVTLKTFAERATGKAIVWFYPDNTGSNVYQEIGFLGGYSNKFLIEVFSDGSIQWLDGSPQQWQQWQEFPTPTDLQTQTWSCLYFKWDCNTNEIELFVNGTSKGKGNAYDTGTAIDKLKIGSGCMAATGRSGYFNDFCIGKYVSPEPSWGVWKQIPRRLRMLGQIRPRMPGSTDMLMSTLMVPVHTMMITMFCITTGPGLSTATITRQTE